MRCLGLSPPTSTNDAESVPNLVDRHDEFTRRMAKLLETTDLVRRLAEGRELFGRVASQANQEFLNSVPFTRAAT
jgi:hypothetical protein